LFSPPGLLRRKKSGPRRGNLGEKVLWLGLTKGVVKLNLKEGTRMLSRGETGARREREMNQGRVRGWSLRVHRDREEGEEFGKGRTTLVATGRDRRKKAEERERLITERREGRSVGY